MSPPGWRGGSLEIAGDLAGILHIYLPLSQFSPSHLGTNIDESGIGALSYESAFEDPLLAEIADAIASELQAQTSAGNLLVEALASSLAAGWLFDTTTPIGKIAACHDVGLRETITTPSLNEPLPQDFIADAFAAAFAPQPVLCASVLNCLH